MNEYSLTPVQRIGDFWSKRDDLFQPFGRGQVNGGKLRQCIMLVNGLHVPYSGLLTYCSIHSPQAPITAAVALSKGLPCEVVYGGTKPGTLARLPMPRLCMKYGARIHIAARSGRHNILYARARAIAEKTGAFIVQYGINIMDYRDVLLQAVARQVENIPDQIDDLIMVCGSGITSTGVMVGLKQYGKRVRRVHLVATAPDRQTFIHGNLQQYGADRDFIYHSLFSQPGFSYERPVQASFGGIAFHPHYEAKMMQWLKGSGITGGKVLIWITGAEPGTAKQK